MKSAGDLALLLISVIAGAILGPVVVTATIGSEYAAAVALLGLALLAGIGIVAVNR